MKHKNALKLARLAEKDTRHGGAAAAALARRSCTITGSREAWIIVGRVYTHPQGKGIHQCPECGSEYVDPMEALECCYDWT